MQDTMFVPALHTMKLSTLFAAFDIIGQHAYTWCVVAMVCASWRKRFPFFFWIQVIQYVEMLVLLFLWLSRNPHYTPLTEILFYPNLLFGALIIGFCIKHHRNLSIIGWAYAIFWQAKWMHAMSWDVQFGLGWEYAVMRFTDIAIYAAILCAVYNSRNGTQPLEETNEHCT
jgi:hypothetical protein